MDCRTTRFRNALIINIHIFNFRQKIAESAWKMEIPLFSDGKRDVDCSTFYVKKYARGWIIIIYCLYSTALNLRFLIYCSYSNACILLLILYCLYSIVRIPLRRFCVDHAVGIKWKRCGIIFIFHWYDVNLRCKQSRCGRGRSIDVDAAVWYRLDLPDITTMYWLSWFRMLIILIYYPDYLDFILITYTHYLDLL